MSRISTGSTASSNPCSTLDEPEVYAAADIARPTTEPRGVGGQDDRRPDRRSCLSGARIAVRLLLASDALHGDLTGSQFEGYADLEEIDWDDYRGRYPNIQRMDRILKAEGRDPNRYKVSKQADAVMLFFLFDDEELQQLFDRLGHTYDRDLVRRTIDYYDRRTSHGSTLSFVTYAGVLAGIDPPSSWDRFMVALQSEVDDIQGGTTKEGIHMGVMSGTLDLLQRSFLGSFVTDDGVLRFAPRLLDRLDGVAFSMRFRGTSLKVGIEGEKLTVLAEAEVFRGPLRIGVGDELRDMGPGESHVFALPAQVPSVRP